jgi:hypothetical protein
MEKVFIIKIFSLLNSDSDSDSQLVFDSEGSNFST